jgi:DNA-binding transcriptional MerR regulator
VPAHGEEVRLTRLKIGEVARRSGLTVRTLRHYEAMGLLKPSARSEGGQRLYGTAELERLQQIVSLRQLGFGLEEIRALLHRPEMSALEVVELHLSRIDERIADLARLQHRLRLVANQLRSGGDSSVDDLLETVEMMTMVEKHYSSEQLEWLARRREEVGETRIKEVEAEWPKLIDEVANAIDRGLRPHDPEAQALAARWMELVREFSGGNQAIEGVVKRVWEAEGEQIVQQHGMNPRMTECMAYINQALT